MDGETQPVGGAEPVIRDCVVIGGGPAGLTAAIYLARFHLAVTVIDAGLSRARLIPFTRNHAGFPQGISGIDLLARMREQAVLHRTEMSDDTVLAVERDGEDFVVRTGRAAFGARAVLLATGVVNRRPAMLDDETHARAVAEGLLRYCPICDGYEVTDRRVGVLGTGQRGCDEALFLRSYTADVTLIAPGEEHELDAGQRARLADAGIVLADSCRRIALGDRQIEIGCGEETLRFDTLYPALGSDIRSQLARAVGAEVSGEGCLLVDSHQRTSVAGLYAAGDVVLGLDQISHAMGEGGVAATTIRNDLARKAPLRRGDAHGSPR
ncbi:MAG: NAD(P)/FAD-dependent oxidoreductase [Candidatus Andeanibacterium colombiense]|uniref:Thioredoxin reductase n=1 Tax=Candidatus Andeanibacterium colombiense TaxID=3121345 RepID=A0AAJ5X5A4_9SPHN|nr:MAG: NAD(P)/FAD-dependent oxidoreductase [Sphingomonadaceae bacterium]